MTKNEKKKTQKTHQLNSHESAMQIIKRVYCKCED